MPRLTMLTVSMFSGDVASWRFFWFICSVQILHHVNDWIRIVYLVVEVVDWILYVPLPARNPTSFVRSMRHWKWLRAPSCRCGIRRRKWRPSRWRWRVSRGLLRRSLSNPMSLPSRRPSSVWLLLRIVVRLPLWRRWALGGPHIHRPLWSPIHLLCGGLDWQFVRRRSM